MPRRMRALPILNLQRRVSRPFGEPTGQRPQSFWMRPKYIFSFAQRMDRAARLRYRDEIPYYAAASPSSACREDASQRDRLSRPSSRRGAWYTRTSTHVEHAAVCELDHIVARKSPVRSSAGFELSTRILTRRPQQSPAAAFVFTVLCARIKMAATATYLSNLLGFIATFWSPWEDCSAQRKLPRRSCCRKTTGPPTRRSVPHRQRQESWLVDRSRGGRNPFLLRGCEGKGVVRSRLWQFRYCLPRRVATVATTSRRHCANYDGNSAPIRPPCLEVRTWSKAWGPSASAPPPIAEPCSAPLCETK